LKRRDLIGHLHDNGCVKHTREGKKHEIFINPKNNKISTVPRHKEIKPGTVKSICKQLEIPLPAYSIH
jgi:predicted RNA binding protein YcfA (HicA-like mRNA interferase family)